MLIDELNIFEYDNYRKLLSDAYDAASARARRYSFRYFSSKAGYKSPSFLKEVIKGRRDLTERGITGVAKAFKMTPSERLHFRHLVALDQATSHEEREDALAVLSSNEHFRKAHKLSDSSFEYLTHWYYPAVHEMVRVPGFCLEPDWISKHLVPFVAPEQVAEALALLERLGLIRQDETGNYLVSTIDAGDTVGGKLGRHAAIAYHQQMLELAGESFSHFMLRDRFADGMTVALSRETFEMFRAEFRDLSKRLGEAGDKDKAPEAVYQFVAYLFPLTKTVEPTTKEDV